MYDVIVVGARCGGSPLAMLLARAGHRVLLVDLGTFPSDQPMSTHLVWPSGVERLSRWGLLDEVRAAAPAIPACAFDFGPFALQGTPVAVGGVSDAYSPRRPALDHALVNAAVKAGAELREGFTVEELVFEEGTVVGVTGRTGAGRVTEQARLVVGADGPQSMVARGVAAPQRHEVPARQGTVWAYWSGVPMDIFEGYPRDWRMVYAWPTADDLVLVGVNWPISDYERLTDEIEREYFEVLDFCSPGLAERLRAGRREERWRRGSTASFFRRSHGPGWALVGDAGCTKDPCTAAGINDAFRDVELLAPAIDDGLAAWRPMMEALAQYEEARDRATKPIYDFACELATFAPPPPETQQLFAALAGSQEHTGRFLGVFAQTVSPEDFFSPASLAAIMSS